MTKHEIRKILLSARKTSHASTKNLTCIEHLDQMVRWLKPRLRDAAWLGTYQPINSERDPAPLTRAIDTPLAFPKVMAPAQPLSFFSASLPQDFSPGAFGVMEPLDSLPQVQPDVMLLPLVGFDRAGYRLGYGGGFYDRTLAKFRSSQSVFAIGYAYDEQLSPIGLDFEPTDLALDAIMTPTRVYEFGASHKVTPWS